MTYTREQLEQVKQWFEDVTEADFSLIGFMGLTQGMVVEMYLREQSGGQGDE